VTEVRIPAAGIGQYEDARPELVSHERFDRAKERDADERDDLRLVTANLSFESLPPLDVLRR
jgi:hypothetical protein